MTKTIAKGKMLATFAIVVIASILLLLGTSQSAWADEPGEGSALHAESVMPVSASPTLSMNSTTAKAGTTCNVDVKISGNPGILGMTLEVTYDSRLTLTAVSNGAAFQALDMTKPGALKSGCRIHWDATEVSDDDVKDGVVATLTFSVPATVAGGSSCAVSVAGAVIGGKMDVYDRDLAPVNLKPATCAISVMAADPTSQTGQTGGAGQTGQTGQVKTSISLNGASVSVPASAVFTGSAITPVPTVKVNGKTLTRNSDYTVAYSNNVNVGTATVTVTGKGSYTGSKSAAFTITKARNVVTVKKTSVKKSYKKSALKKKAKAIALPKATAKFGSVTWKVAAKDKKKVLSLSKGKVKVKKGAKKGVYVIKLKATAAKTGNYKAATSKVVTVKVTVK